MNVNEAGRRETRVAPAKPQICFQHCPNTHNRALDVARKSRFSGSARAAAYAISDCLHRKHAILGLQYRYREDFAPLPISCKLRPIEYVNVHVINLSKSIVVRTTPILSMVARVRELGRVALSHFVKRVTFFSYSAIWEWHYLRYGKKPPYSLQ